MTKGSNDKPSEPGVLPGTPAGDERGGPGVVPGTPAEARDQRVPADEGWRPPLDGASDVKRGPGRG